MRLRRIAYWFIGLVGLAINLVSLIVAGAFTPSGILHYLSEFSPFVVVVRLTIMILFALVGYLLLRYDALLTERKQAEEVLTREKEGAQKYLDIAGTMIAAIDAGENIALINEKGCEILGYHQEELLGQNWFNTLVPEAMRDKVRAVFGKLMAGEVEPVEYYENILLTKDGQERRIAFHNIVVTDPSGRITGVLFSGDDITERKQAEEALQAAYQRNETVLATSMDGFFTMRPDGTIGDCNEVFCQMVGYSRDELLAMKITDLEAVETPAETAQHIKEVMEAGGTRFETTHRRKDGTLIDLEISSTLVELPDESFFVCFARDITETKRLWDELNHQLLRDALTGVYNRRYFNETIIQEIKRADRYEHHTSFVMGDMDGLKAVNDNFGHLVGDQILQGIAGVLERSVRAADMVIRYGGDEFLVVMPETPEDQAQAAASRIEQNLADWLTEQVEIGALQPDVLAQVGFSMGVASCRPGDEVAVEEVLARADEAMYRAKQAKGRPLASA